MQFNRTFLKGVAVLVAVAACSDGAVPPVAPTRATSLPLAGAGRTPESDEQVTVTRTIEVQPPTIPGQDTPSPVRRVKTITFGARTVAAPNADLSIGGALKVRSRPKIASVEDLPIVGLTEPVRLTSFRGAVVPWRRSVRMPDDLAMTVEMFGTGDAPASMIRFVRNGTVVLTVTQEWELWQRQWNLLRRETTTPDRSLHEVVEVTRVGRSGTALQSTVAWAQSFGQERSLSPSFDYYGEDDDGGCLACAALVNAAQAKYLKFMITDAAALAACLLAPTGAALPACFAATAIAATAFVDYQQARWDRDDCKNDPAKCPPPAPPGGPSCARRGVSNIGLTLTCSPGSGGGGGGGDTGGSPSTEYYCTYYYEYDLYSGEVLYAELLSCGYR